MPPRDDVCYVDAVASPSRGAISFQFKGFVGDLAVPEWASVELHIDGSPQTGRVTRALVDRTPHSSLGAWQRVLDDYRAHCALPEQWPDPGSWPITLAWWHASNEGGP